MTADESSLAISIHVTADGPMVFVRGEVDLASAPQLREAALTALSLGPKVLRLDLAHVTFMDVSGLHVLLSAQRRAALMGGRLVLMGTSPTVERLLDLTGTRAELDGMEVRPDVAPVAAVEV